MLNPNKDRLDYGEILTPPANYTLDFAVGTTYSLDLDALVGASLALGLSAETDSQLLNNPVCLLEALRTTGDKIAIFSEAGQIHVPSGVTRPALYILLEKMVFSVKTTKRRGIAAYPSFHPKLWLVRYKKDSGDYLYRVVILSRNLTFDRSWDVAYYMDGEPNSKSSNKNEPLCDFLQYLIGCLPADEYGKLKAKLIKSMIKELPNVCFKPSEKEFEDFEFIPIGVKKGAGEYYAITDEPLFTQKFHEILIISPFLTGRILSEFNNRSLGNTQNNILITRKTSLNKLKPQDISTFQIYTMKEAVIDGESNLTDNASDIKAQDIHAKVYMTKKYSDTDLYLGSLNASHNAFNGNIEFLLQLRTKNRHLNIDKLTKSLFGTEIDGTDNPFQLVNLQDAIIDEVDEKENDLNSIIKQICRTNSCAEVLKASENTYDISVHFGDIDTKNYKIEVRPLLSNKAENFDKKILFEGLQITQLSEFFAIRVSYDQQSVERVIIIPTSGLSQDREKAVVTSVVSNKECFYRYIAFLLGDNAILSAMEGNAVINETSTNLKRKAYKIPALYEKMLLTAASAPEKFKGIEYLIKAISDDGIIPEDFQKLYETFKKVVN